MATHTIVFTRAQLNMFEDLVKRKMFAMQVGFESFDEAVFKGLVSNIAQAIKIGRENGYIITPKKNK